MARLVLLAGQRIGRFAALLFILPVAAAFFCCLSLLDHHPGWFLGTAIIVLPLGTIAVALLIGMLFANFRRRSVRGVSEVDAPGLWATWSSVAGSRLAENTVIVIDDRFNASVELDRPWFGLLRDRVILTIGLPVLAVADQRTVADVLAHEYAHIVNKDVNGYLSLAELEAVFEFVFEHAPADRTISGRLLYNALGWLANPLEEARIRLSREAEIAADRLVAASGHAIETAKSIMFFAAVEAFIDVRVYQPLKRELLEAMRPPTPPLARLLEAASQLSDRALLNAFARKAWERPDNRLSDHPSWAETLLALGYSEPPEIEPVKATALSTMLAEGWSKQAISDFDRAWTTEVANALER